MFGYVIANLEGLTQAQKDYIRDDAATIAVLELLKREAKQAQ